jgi:hypothetical protein
MSSGLGLKNMSLAICGQEETSVDALDEIHKTNSKIAPDLAPMQASRQKRIRPEFSASLS